MPCTIHLSNGLGGDPSQGIRAFVSPQSNPMRGRWGSTSVEAVRVLGGVLQIQLDSLMENGGEDLIWDLVNRGGHAVVNPVGNRP